MDYVGLGRRIRKERKARHMTQGALAEKSGVSISFIGHIERGSRKASIETLVAICNVMSLSMDMLLQDSLTPNASEGLEKGTQKDLLREINRMIEDNMDRWGD